MRSVRAIFVTTIVAIASPVPVLAINKCTDKNGKITYQEHACSNSDASAQAVRTAPSLSTGDDAAGQARLAKIKSDNAKFDAMIDGKVMRGMSESQVQNAWGRPTKINRSVGSYGTHEQWVYDRGRNGAQYIYFENGVVTSMQSPQ